MLLISNLSLKEKYLLSELINFSGICKNIEITPDVLPFVKRGVLEAAIELSLGKISPKKIINLKNIINKIVYPDLKDAELVVPKGNILKDKE